MPEVFKVKNYFVSNTNPPPETRCNVKKEDLNNNEGYHILLNPDEQCIAFGDIDHCVSKYEVMDILKDIKTTFEINKDDISYTCSEKVNEKGIDEFGSHWVIKTISTNFLVLKEIMQNTLQKKYGNIKIDTSVYKKSWFRLPNQTNESKTNIHTIMKGEPIDFLVQYNENINKCKNGPSEKLLSYSSVESSPVNQSSTFYEKTKTKSISSKVQTKSTGKAASGKAASGTTSETIKKMVLKMDDYFDGFDNWSKLGFILHNEFQGNSDGLDLFDELSKNFKNYKGKFDVSKFYLSIKPGAGGKKKLTIKSLYHMYQELFPEEEEEEENKFLDPKYLEIKIEFEKRVFKLNNPISFVILSEDNTLQIVKLGDLIIWAKGKFEQIEIDEDGKLTDFVNIWINDPNHLQKNKLVFDPSMTSNKNYNMFKGFNFTDGDSVSEDNSMFLKLLRYISNDNTVYEYMKCWISHIIKTPWKKTNVAVVLYSKIGGVGKNAIVDGLCKLFGNYSGHIESIEDITKNFNNHITNKLFIYGDEINANAKKVSDKLKQVITRPTQNLEKKGFDSIEINDYTNWLFTTNNENCFKIEEDERRLLMIECPCIPLPREDYENYYKEINDDNELNKLYNFFKSYDNSKYKIGVDRVLMTNYKKQLSYENVPAYIEMFYKKPFQFSDQVFTSTELFTIAKEYAKTNFLSQNFTMTSFGKYTKTIFDRYVCKSSCIKFNFKDLTINQFKKILFKNNEGYYRYINDLDANYIPKFDEKSS